jgi:hypothetical protein
MASLLLKIHLEACSIRMLAQQVIDHLVLPREWLSDTMHAPVT